MRTVHKARIVPDTAPDSMTERVIRVSDIKVPLGVVLGRYESLTDSELEDLVADVQAEYGRRQS